MNLPDLPAVEEIEDELLLKFVIDMAQGIHQYATIAERYGFGSEKVLWDFLHKHPAILNQIRRYKAAFESDQAVPERVRLKAGLGAEDLIPYLVLRLKQADTPLGQLIDGYHKLSRSAGTDGLPPVGKDGVPVGGGTVFNLAIMFGSKPEANLKLTV